MMQLRKYVSIADKNLVKRRKVVEAKVEAWKTEAQKAGSCKEKLQTIKNLSVFSLKLFFFIKIFLEKAR